MNTVESVDIDRFMGKWYVLAGRFTFTEVEVHNGQESYTWNSEKQRIDVNFTYNQSGFDGPLLSIPQKAWIYDEKTKAHWKVSPFWPLKFNYLIVELDQDYKWTAIGVPDQKYLWIMARDWKNPTATIKIATERLRKKGYDVENLVLVPQRWPPRYP